MLFRTTTTRSSGGSCSNDDYGFKDALEKSLLFYEAQRSGPLPANNRVPWRHDSALDDKGQNGEDLTGGYYDGKSVQYVLQYHPSNWDLFSAGDHVKFGFPLASALTILSWGGIEHKAGYEKAGQLNYLLDAVKWGMDYLIKAHIAPTTLYGQV